MFDDMLEHFISLIYGQNFSSSEFSTRRATAIYASAARLFGMRYYCLAVASFFNKHYC